MVRDSYLAHHGILGQRWGVRRFQNKDGSLTPKGKKRYDEETSEPKSEDQKRADSLKKIAIGATVATAIIGAAYGAKKYSEYVSENKDVIIKGGEALQRISAKSETELHDQFYAAFGKHDMNRYKNMLPKHFDDISPSAKGVHSLKELKAKEDLKIASVKNAEKIYKDLFKEQAGDYELFNRYLAGNHENANVKKFYKALADNGYDGLIDVNDKKYSGYNAKNPAIIINKGKIAVEKISDIGTSIKENKANFDNEGKKILGEEMVKELISDNNFATMGVYSGAFAASSGLAYMQAKNKLNNSNKKVEENVNTKHHKTDARS